MNGTVVVFFISCVRNHLLRFCMVRGVYIHVTCSTDLHVDSSRNYCVRTPMMLGCI